MVPELILFLILIASSGGLSAKKRASVNRYIEMEEYDPIAVTRCDVQCLGYIATEKVQCHDQCMEGRGTKPGSCPLNFEEISVFATACLNVCSTDYECPHIEKCCSHSCGVTCQPAIHLANAGLPNIPQNVSARELRGSSVVEIQWTYSTTTLNNRGALFLIEARSHFGRFYNEGSLGSWIPIFQAIESPAVIKDVVLTAHWYVFRVAAVNDVGTQGYSSPSLPFYLSKSPSKPGRPKRLGVTKVHEVNGTVWGDLHWAHPHSDVPIKRYKVYWSRRLPGFHPKNASDSVLVHQRTVPKSKPRFELKNLEKNEFYFIQVQAIANFGREKLKGVKAELFFNTSILEDQFSQPLKRRHQNHDKT